MPLKRRQFLQHSALALSAGAMTLAVPNTGAADTPTEPLWHIGCFTRPWAAFEYRVALDAITEAGFLSVGLMTTKSDNGLVLSVQTTPEQAAEIGKECRSRSLVVRSAYGGDIPVSTSIEAGIAGLRHLVDLCVLAGVENLMMGGVTEEKLHDPYYKAIAECCPYAQEKGIGISVKPHGGTNATGPVCRRIIESVGHPNFRLWYDPGNIFYYSDGKLDPVDDSATVDGLVVGMSIKDFRLPKDVELTPGDGMVDFPKVLARLKAGGFRGGSLLIECLAHGDLQALQVEAKRAKAIVEQLVA